jgi:hypothetical protein
MPEFISKLQHYICEKGEFTDEKVRSLVQTKELIKNFPWDEERPYADADNITGPSITIQDESNNFFKLTVFPPGEFIVYYLATDGHLYEYHIADMESALNEVTAFFNGQTNLQKFKKHFFTIGNKANFQTRDFTYHVKLWRVLTSCTGILVIFIFALVMMLKTDTATSMGAKFIFAIPTLFFGGLLAFVLSRYFSAKNQLLKISKGNDTFYFGDPTLNKYNKNDVEQIVIYQPGGRKKIHDFYVYEISFNDGLTLKFSNMLTSEADLKNKFPSDYFSYGLKSPFWKL